MSLAWIAGAGVIAVASFVMGLTGFGIALVSMAFLPYLMSPVTAIVILTIYALVLSVAIVAQLRCDVKPRTLVDLLVGSVVGTPLGVWGLAALPTSALNRLIGLTLVVAVGLEWRRLYPTGLGGRAWGFAAGVLSGVIGGAVGTPGPPVILYGASQPGFSHSRPGVSRCSMRRPPSSAIWAAWPSSTAWMRSAFAGSCSH